MNVGKPRTQHRSVSGHHPATTPSRNVGGHAAATVDEPLQPTGLRRSSCTTWFIASRQPSSSAAHPVTVPDVNLRRQSFSRDVRRRSSALCLSGVGFRQALVVSVVSSKRRILTGVVLSSYASQSTGLSTGVGQWLDAASIATVA